MFLIRYFYSPALEIDEKLTSLLKASWELGGDYHAFLAYQKQLSDAFKLTSSELDNLESFSKELESFLTNDALNQQILNTDPVQAFKNAIMSLPDRFALDAFLQGNPKINKHLCDNLITLKSIADKFHEFQQVYQKSKSIPLKRNPDIAIEDTEHYFNMKQLQAIFEARDAFNEKLPVLSEKEAAYRKEALKENKDNVKKFFVNLFNKELTVVTEQIVHIILDICETLKNSGANSEGLYTESDTDQIISDVDKSIKRMRSTLIGLLYFDRKLFDLLGSLLAKLKYAEQSYQLLLYANYSKALFENSKSDILTQQKALEALKLFYEFKNIEDKQTNLKSFEEKMTNLVPPAPPPPPINPEKNSKTDVDIHSNEKTPEEETTNTPTFPVKETHEAEKVEGKEEQDISSISEPHSQQIAEKNEKAEVKEGQPLSTELPKEKPVEDKNPNTIDVNVEPNPVAIAMPIPNPVNGIDSANTIDQAGSFASINENITLETPSLKYSDAWYDRMHFIFSNDRKRGILEEAFLVPTWEGPLAVNIIKGIAYAIFMIPVGAVLLSLRLLIKASIEFGLLSLEAALDKKLTALKNSASDLQENNITTKLTNGAAYILLGGVYQVARFFRVTFRAITSPIRSVKEANSTGEKIHPAIGVLLAGTSALFSAAVYATIGAIIAVFALPALAAAGILYVSHAAVVSLIKLGTMGSKATGLFANIGKVIPVVKSIASAPSPLIGGAIFAAPTPFIFAGVKAFAGKIASGITHLWNHSQKPQKEAKINLLIEPEEPEHVVAITSTHAKIAPVMKVDSVEAEVVPVEKFTSNNNSQPLPKNNVHAFKFNRQNHDDRPDCDGALFSPKKQ